MVYDIQSSPCGNVRRAPVCVCVSVCVQGDDNYTLKEWQTLTDRVSRIHMGLDINGVMPRKKKTRLYRTTMLI